MTKAPTKKPGKPLVRRMPGTPVGATEAECNKAVLAQVFESVGKEQAFRSRMGHVIADSKKLADGSVIGGVARMALAAGINTNATRALAEAEELLRLPTFPEVAERLQRAAARLAADPSDATPNEVRDLAESVMAHLPRKAK